MKPELCLGTVQFGMSYGITNKKGKLNKVEINKILKNAIKNKVMFLDTAQNYGDSEIMLGETNQIKDKFKVINKFSNNSKMDYGPEIIKEWENNLKNSLNSLKINHFDSFLIHDKNDLLKKNRDYLLDWLESLKAKSIVKRIGVSIYEKNDLDNIPLEKIDIVQLPFSIYDQRLLKNGLIKELSSNGIAIHLRSIFLQGLILQDAEEWPNFISKEFKNHHKKTQLECAKKHLTMLEATLRFAYYCDGIEAILFGVTSNEELTKILDIWKLIKKNSNYEFSPKYHNFKWHKSKEIDPRKWPKIL